MKNCAKAIETAKLFEGKLGEENIISEIFDYLNFDCMARLFVDPCELDANIRSFYNTRSLDDLTEIIRLIEEGKRFAAVDEKALVLQVKNYIIEHLTENITFEQVAREFHISYYYLVHLFKKTSGQSMSQFRTYKRLEKAAFMLLRGDDKISDIACACGFESVSYFSEAFIKKVGDTPSNFRARLADYTIHPFYNLDDLILLTKMPKISFLSDKAERIGGPVRYSTVYAPCKEFGLFMHEAAVIYYKGVLYASWYTCPEKELVGYTPILARRSYDNGETWGEVEIIAEDKSEKILYCPPIFGICDGKLYLMLNQMVAPDHIHSLDLYVLNEENGKFEMLWSRPVPFKLNTNVVTLPNGKLILPGRLAKLDGFPNTPAVMISDSGKIDAEWRIVKAAEDGSLPDGERLVHPEATLILCDDTLYMFNRNDHRRVPLVYVSKDYGETWSEAHAHDIPYINSKIYTGELEDGRYYLIANTDKKNRSVLEMFISEKGKMCFNKRLLLLDCEKDDDINVACHYPAAVEKEGVLNIIATMNYLKDGKKTRGAVLFKVDLAEHFAF